MIEAGGTLIACNCLIKFIHLALDFSQKGAAIASLFKVTKETKANFRIVKGLRGLFEFAFLVRFQTSLLASFRLSSIVLAVVLILSRHKKLYS